MADSDITVVGWRGWDNRKHGGAPRNPQDARGLKTIITDSNGDQHQYWSYTLVPFQSDAEWWVYITALAVDHNIPLDDSPPSDDEPPEDYGDYYDDEEEEDEEEQSPGIVQRATGFFRRIFGRGR